MSDLLQGAGDASLEHEAVAQADSSASAIALERKRKGGARSRGDEAADRFLEDQHKLVAKQLHHLDEQLKQLKITRWDKRLGALLKLMTATAGLAIVAAVGWLAWDAHNAGGLVFEPFSAPPGLAAQGLTGQVVAARILDQLGRIQAEANAPQIPQSAESDWKHEAHVEIPETGVSITELQKLLREKLGHETHVTGELTQDAKGFVLTVRTGGEPGERLEAAPDKLDDLLGKAAESVFGVAEPDRFGNYLASHDRPDEAAKVFQRIAVRETPRRRALALVELSNVTKDRAVAMTKVREAIRLDPDLPNAWSAISGYEFRHGHPEEGLRAGRRALALWRGPRARDYAPWFVRLQISELRSFVDDRLGDDLGAARASEDFGNPTPDEPISICQGCAGGALITAGNFYAHVGDGANQTRLRELGLATIGDPAIRPQAEAAGEASLAIGIDDWPRVLALYDDPVKGPLMPLWQGPVGAQINRAYALAVLGRAAEAQALASTLSADPFNRARIMALSAYRVGDLRGGDAIFRQLVRMAPSMPTPHLDRGQALAKAGRLDDAIGEFAAATKLGPNGSRWRIAWGEALMAKGDYAGAAAKFAKSEPHAPRLGHLHLKWAEALAKQGHRDQARAQLKAASGMDLSTADRAELAAQRI